MSDKTAIEWTDATWNPVRGCSRVSEGCRNCYAERFAARFSGAGRSFAPYSHHGKWTGRVDLVPAKLEQPLRWQRPRRIFVNSMSDLFHESLPDEAIDRVFAVMALAPHHTFQILTKRAERMLRYCTSIGNDDGEFEPDLDGEALRDAMIEGATQRLYVDRGGHRCVADNLAVHQPLPKVWLGVSVESPDHTDRIDLLRQTPAALRFLSLEPLLADLGTLDLRGIDWVIVGGESGPNARPMHPDWVRDLRDQCVAAGVPFFFKQWGAHLHEDIAYDRDLLCIAEGPPADGSEFYSVGKKHAGRELDGRTWDEFPKVEVRP